MTEVLTPQRVIALLAERGERPAIVTVMGEEALTWSGAALAEPAIRLASGLLSKGLEPGEPVGLYGANRPEWVIARLGIGAAGALVAPFDDLLPEDDVVPLIAHNRCRQVFTTGAHLAGLRGRFGAQEPRWILLDAEPGEALPEGVVAYESLLAPDAGPLPEIDPDAPAMVVTTSGTTGEAKSFTLSHRKLSANVAAIAAQKLVGEGDRALLPLPLDNVYPYVVGFLSVLACGATLVFPEALTGPQIVKALKLGRASLMIGVPRLYAAMIGAIDGRVAAKGAVARRLFASLIALSLFLHRRFGIRAGRVLFGGLHRQFGPDLRIMVSGGARLEPELIWRMEALGWRVLSGYGLSEVGSVFTANLPGRKRIGSEGHPLHGPETLRIADPDDEGIGEIQLKGPSVFEGYRDNPEANAAAFTEDGWFRTGDLGRVDEGFVFITGRAKEMIVLGGGKNVFPEEVEAAYRESPFIEEIGVLELKGNLVGLIVPDREAVRASGYTRVEDLFRVALAECGKPLPSFQRLTGFALSREPLPRTRLGKYRRFLLPELFEQARRAAAPDSPAPLSEEDRRLLAGAPASEIWALLKARYPDKPVSLDAEPQLDLGIDSLEWVSLTLELEQRFGIRLSEEQIAEIRSLRDLIVACREAAAAPGAAPATGEAEAAETWLRPPGSGARLLGAALHGLNRVLARLIFRLRVEGLAHVPPEAPCLFVANHVSDLDPALLAAALPAHQRAALHWGGDRVRLFGRPSLHFLLRALRVFPVDEQRPAASLALAGKVLRGGGTLPWFPESWRSPDGRLQAFLPGIGHLVMDYHGPIVPLLIQGTFEAMPRDRRLPRPHPVVVRFGPPLDAAELIRRCASSPDQPKAIAEALQAAVAALAAERTEKAEKAG